MANRTPENASLHDNVVMGISRKRFDDIKYDVYTNPNGEKNAYVGPESDPLYPDIVVLEKGYGQRNAISIGEVETADSINEEEANQWSEYAATKIPFYLYVPAGHAEETRNLLNTNSIEISGLRTYRYEESGELTITNIF